MASAAASPELKWTRERLLALADLLDPDNQGAVANFAAPDFNETVRSAATALRFMAALAVQDECHQQAPYKPMYRIRRSDGVIIWTCGHNPPHESRG